ncbi:MAG: VTT domain-containing protein [Patescibacteria group bacterium]
MQRSWKIFVSVAGIVALFIGASYLADIFKNDLGELVRAHQLFGPLLYIAIEIAGVIAAPVSTLALIPLGVALWGHVTTALLSLVGWTAGSILAFELARAYGQPLLAKFLNLKDLGKIERFLPQGNLFWGVVGLRLIIPIDLISYALGLFTPIDRWRYNLATVIGYLPSAFAYSYAATASLGYQIALGAVVICLALLVRFR